MFVPKINAWKEDADIKQFIKENAFGILILTDAHGIPQATHIPILLEQTENGTTVLRGHVSRANPSGKLIGTSKNALVIFHGAHSYVSSSWYEKENVSTWNYTAVHIYGKIRELTDAELLENVTHLTEKYESAMKKPRQVASMSQDMIHKEMRGIIGFEMSLEDVQAKRKLSQNRNDPDYTNVVNELEQTPDAASKAVAEEMKKLRDLDYDKKADDDNR